MHAINPLNIWKTVFTFRTFWRRLPALVFLLATVSSMHAVPVVSDNDGYFFDDYADNLGVFSASQVKVAGGTVSLISPNTSGNYRTVEIAPTSFDQWGQLTIVGTYGALGDLTAEVRSEDGLTVLIPAQPVNSPIDLSGLDPTTVPAIRVQVYFDKTAVVAPTVGSLRVTWRSVSQLLIDKQGPASVGAGENIVYRVRYSVNYVRAQGVVIWDQLGQYPDSLTYPTEISPTPYLLQNDNLTFVSATKGGVYHAGPAALVVNGISVPPNSVYWNLGIVDEGTTDLLNFTVATRSGTLDGTTVTNHAYIDAANAALSESEQVITTIRSTPGPEIVKSGGAGIYNIGGVLQTITGTLNGFGVSARNHGNETMYKSVIYDDVSDLLNMIDEQGTPGVPADDFLNISPGGTFIANYTPPGGMVSFPAIVWNAGTLEPGGSFSGSFSVQLRANPPEAQYVNQACLISDQTTPVCSQIVVRIGLDGTPSVLAGKAGPNSVPHGGNAAFSLSAYNTAAVKLNKLVFADRVPTNTMFRSAWFDDQNLIASGAVIFYSTSVVLPQDWSNPPPMDYTQAPTDLDVVPNNHWKRYDLNPPLNPAAVTWIAFYIPQLDSPHLPNNGTPALVSPPTPITGAVGFYDVTVFSPADPCADDVIFNRGLFEVNETTSLTGVTAPIAGGPIRSADDWAVGVIGAKTRLSVSANISPDVVLLPGNTTYSLSVGNSGSDAIANVQVVVQLSQLSINGVLQYPSVQGISPAGTFDVVNGRITFALGLLASGVSRSIQVQMDLPTGIINDTEFTVGATATGQGVLCGAITASATARGKVQSSPKLRVFARDIVDLIPSAAEYDYELEYINLGTAPSTKTWVVERVPKKTVFVRAYGNPTITSVWFSGFDNLPPQALTPLTAIDGSTIATRFSPGTLNNNGTPGNLTDDYWTSPFGEQTYWIAWEVDDPTLSPPQFSLNVPQTVGFTARNDHDAQGPSTAGSPEGTLLFDTVGIFSHELLQAIGNQVITTIKNQPSILVQKSGPSVLEAGVPFNWTVSYYNNSLTPAQSVVVTDTLPPGITLIGATHTWNAAALANGAPVGNNSQAVPTSAVVNGDGSTTVTFVIAGPIGYRGNAVSLAALEGGTFTLHVQSDPATASGTTLINIACGTADTAGDSITSCDDHQVTIFRPDLQLLKYASPATVLAGGVLNYQLVVANRGPINARNVTLTDLLPTGVTYVPGSLSVLTPGYTLGAPAIGGQTLTWSVAGGNALTRTSLPAGEVPGTSGNIIIQFSGQVGAAVPGCTTLNNVAQVTTVSTEEGVYANVASASAAVPPPELAIAKSGPALARPGNRVSWNISWVNQSPQSAAGVYLVDTLPSNDADSNSDVTFVSVAVPSGVTTYYHAGAVTTVPVFNPLNPLTGGWSATPTTPVNHIAFLVGALAGNAGPFTAQVTVDLIDPVSHILPPPGVSFTNAVIIAQAVPLCEDTTDNTATAVVRTPALDLSLKKVGSVEGPLPGIAPGQPITYALSFENSGTVNAYGVRVTDTIPATLVPGIPLDNFTVVALIDGLGNPVSPVDQSGVPIVGAVPVTRVISGNVVTWYFGTTTPSDVLYYKKVGVPPGSKGSFELRAIVAASVADNTLICNPATVAADVGTEELLANNIDQSCVVARRADVAVRKFGMELLTGDPNFAEFGGLILYRIEYNNLGSIGAQDVVIDEIVSRGVSLVSVNPPPGATVTYSPNQANATSFSVRFATLPAPANSVGSVAGSSSADNGLPTLDSLAVDCANNQLTLTFSEAMDLGRATSLSNYQISNNVTIQGIMLSADGRVVVLSVSPLSSTNNYVLRANNLTDVAGNFMASNVVANFHCPTAPVIISQPPAGLFVVENQAVTLAVVATGGTPLFYQWSRDGVPIPGATNASLTLNPVSLVDNGATYRVEVSNNLGSVLSATSTLNVFADTTPPVLLSAVVDPTLLKIYLTWNEPMDAGTAAEPSNYLLGPSMGTETEILGLSLEYHGSNVVMNLGSPLIANVIYSLQIFSQSDLSGNQSGPVTRPVSSASINCCNNCSSSNAVTNIVTVYPGYNFLSVPLCLTASNTLLNTILPVAPQDALFFKWNFVAQAYGQASTYFDVGDPAFNGWYDAGGNPANETLVLGEGFVLFNPGPAYTITFVGCAPNCGPSSFPCDGDSFSLAGKHGLGVAAYADLSSCALSCGRTVSIWDPALQVFNNHTYLNGAWTPQEPVVPDSASAFVFGPLSAAFLANNSNQFFALFPPIAPFNCTSTPPVSDCLPLNSNGVYEASALARPNGFLGWGTLFVDANVPDGTHMEYSIGRLVGSTPVYDLGPLYTSVNVGPNGLDLSGINPAYSNLVFRAQPFSTNGTNNPCLKEWKMTYHSADWPSLTFTVRVDGSGADSCGALPIDNTVAISTTTPEISLANNTTNYAMNTRLTDLRVAMSVNKAAALASQALTYQLDWAVLGPQAAPNTYLQVVLGDGDGNGTADVTLNPFVPVPGVTVYYNIASTLTPPLFDPATPMANGWTVNRANANHIVFLLGNLAPNSAGSISFVAVLRPGTANRTLISTVTGYTERREADCNNSGSALTFIGTLANVYVQKTAPGCVHPGNLVTFTIRYGNNGNAPAANVIVADILPAGLTFVSAVPAPTGPGLTWNNLGAISGTLGVFETGVITVVAQLDNNYALVGQSLANLATISTSSGEANLGDNQALAVLDCITVDLAGLSGYAYHDRNNNGLREFAAGEIGIPNVVVTLTGTDVFGAAVTLNALTDQDGQYNFSGLNPGAYIVTETQPATWASTADTIGAVNNMAQGNNSDPLDDRLGVITLNGGDSGVEYNFGENYLSLGNLVWRDDNNNGQQGGGEPGLSGVTVQLWSPGTNGVIGGGDDQLLESTTTSSSGLYQFTHLLPGNYYVVIPVNNFTSGGSLQNVPVSSTPTTLTDTGAIGPDNRDAGAQFGGSGTATVSPVVNLALGQEAPTAVDGNDFNGMLTLDFGFLCAQTPGITCPPTIAVSCAAGVPAPNPSGVPASAACASCGTGMNVVWAGDVMSASNCVNRFVITRTYRATDGCGNSATCQQLITVNDITPPVISCPPNGSVCQLQLFCGYTQGGWGAGPAGNNPGMILLNNFAFVYKNGFVEIGIPGSGGYSIKLTSAAAIETYLPSGQTAGAFTKDATDPKLTSAGVFGGQVLALQLNVDFSDAGVIGGSTGNLGDVVLNDPASPLNGKTVRQILAIANTALGGGNVSSYGVTISSLNALVDSLNQAFDNCQASAWATAYLTVPAPPPVDSGTATAVDNCNAQPAVTYSDVVTSANAAGSYIITRTWRAVDACGNSSVCNQTLSFNGRPPTGLTATGATASVTLRWNASAGAATYKVKRSTTNGGPYTVIVSGITATNYTDTTASNGTVYYYVVSAIRSGVETCNSMQVTAIPFAPVPSPWQTKDIGAVGAAGGASYGSSKFTVIGSGADIGGTDDEFRWVYQLASGDCSLIARVVSLGNTDSWAKAGVMIRENVSANAKHASTFITPAHGVTFQYRTASGGNSVVVNTTGLVTPYWLKVARVGNTFTSSVSPNGTTWTTLGSQTITMGASVQIGLGVTSHNDGALCPAVFENVTATP